MGDSFRIVNYAIMLDLPRILSHCTLSHIIGQVFVSQHLVSAHIIIPLRMASILCRFFQLNKNTLKRSGVDGSTSFRSVLLWPSPDVPTGWSAKWIKVQEQMSSLQENVVFKLRIRRLSYIYPLSKSSAPPVSKLRSVGELGSSKTTGSLSPSSIYPCMQPPKWPPRKNYVDTGSRYWLV